VIKENHHLKEQIEKILKEKEGIKEEYEKKLQEKDNLTLSSLSSIRPSIIPKFLPNLDLSQIRALNPARKSEIKKVVKKNEMGKIITSNDYVAENKEVKELKVLQEESKETIESLKKKIEQLEANLDSMMEEKAQLDEDNKELAQALFDQKKISDENYAKHTQILSENNQMELEIMNLKKVSN